MNPAFPWFDKPCIEAFSFLVSRYGFEEPEIRQLGRECFISYRKGNRWVSIAYEPYSVPIVELFYPTHDIKNRRIPRLQHGLSNPRKFIDTDETQQRLTLQAQAADLEAKEVEFLIATTK
jgi:hypothetical protein